MAHEFDVKAVNMVNPEEREKLMKTKEENRISGFVSPSSHDCVFAVQDNWKWLTKLVDCIQFHLKNAAAYHQVHFYFFFKWVLCEMESLDRLYVMTGKYQLPL